MAVELGERWSAWHADVRQAAWEQEGCEQDVLAVLGPHAPGAVQQARDAAARAMSHRGRHVLPLLGVEGTGREVAWLYPMEVVASLARIPRGVLGRKGALEVLQALARTLGDLPHPGPTPECVLLDGRGTVRVAGFVGPWELTPDWAPPPGRVPGTDPWRDTAYQLGLLYLWLLGASVAPSEDAGGHEHQVRRALIDVMSQPGPPLPEEHRGLIRDLLAWDPRDRPDARTLVHRLEGLHRRETGEGLAALAREHFATWLQPHRRPSFSEPFAFDDTPDTTLEVPRGIRTLDGEGNLAELPEEDDPTVDSELGVVPGSERTPTSAIERGSLPLRVGPPAEAVRPRPRLPEGFLGADESTVETPRRREPDAPDWLTWLGVVLLGSAVGLGIWLAFG